MAFRSLCSPQILAHQHSNIRTEDQDILYLCCLHYTVCIGRLGICLDSFCSIWYPSRITWVSHNITVNMCLYDISVKVLCKIMVYNAKKRSTVKQLLSCKNMLHATMQSFCSGLFDHLCKRLFCPSYKNRPKYLLKVLIPLNLYSVFSKII